MKRKQTFAKVGDGAIYVLRTGMKSPIRFYQENLAGTKERNKVRKH